MILIFLMNLWFWKMPLIEVLKFGERYLEKCKFHISKEHIEINDSQNWKKILQEEDSARKDNSVLFFT